MYDWEQHRRIWDEAERKANVGVPITPDNNPLRKLIGLEKPLYRRNMEVLERDYDMRKSPATGGVYAGLMDNMRYGG